MKDQLNHFCVNKIIYKTPLLVVNAVNDIFNLECKITKNIKLNGGKISCNDKIYWTNKIFSLDFSDKDKTKLIF